MQPYTCTLHPTPYAQHPSPYTPSQASAADAGAPVHVAVLADPQLTDATSYDVPPAVARVAAWYCDLFLLRAWRRVALAHSPDQIVFLGDLVDGGSRRAPTTPLPASCHL